MKIQRIVYGADRESDTGWRVLLPNPKLSRKDEAFFVELCERVVPLVGATGTRGRVYFGAARRGRQFLCCGEYVGRDRFGREGAWRFQGFIAPSIARPLPPHATTEQLVALSGDGSETELELNETTLPPPCNPPALLSQLLSQQGSVVLVAPEEDPGVVGTMLDNLQSTAKRDILKYVYPAQREDVWFDVVGLPFEEARKEGGVLPKARVDTSKRRWRLAALLLGACALTGILFGVWGCAGWQNSRRQEEQYRRVATDLEERIVQLQKSSARLRRIRTELDAEFQDVLEKARNGKAKQISVKIENIPSYDFGEKESKAILAELLRILQLIDNAQDVEGLRRLK